MWRSRTTQTAFRSTSRSLLLPSTRRLYSKKPTPEDASYAETHSIQQSFAQHPIYVLNVGGRFLKYSFIGLVLLGTTTFAAFQGTHIWVENVELKKQKEDSDAIAWGWDIESEKWNGDDEKDGTDPGLGYKGRTNIRAAWMALNWGVGESTAVIGSEASSNSDGLLGPRGLTIIDPRLVRAEDGLRTAVDIAEARNIEGKLQPWTLSRVLSLHASVLERMGQESSQAAKAQYERAWATQPGFSKESPRLAMKIGDLCFRLGDHTGAWAWWERSLSLIQGKPMRTSASEAEFTIPTDLTVPESPAAQRTLLSVLASCSALLSRTGRLKEAKALDETAFNLTRSISLPESISSASPAQALHALTILHRSSVFCIHRAELGYALKEKPAVVIQWLTTAAQSSERVAQGLATTTTPSSPIPPKSTNLVLSSSYTASSMLNRPAGHLFRDSHRAASESWNLLGILTEKKDKQGALQCYERAVRWASKPTVFGEPGDETLATDWEAVWGNYTRLGGTL